MTGIDYRILGSLEAIRDGERLALGGAKQRAALAILLLNANRVVTNDALVEALWSGQAPGKPLTAIQGYVSHLRRLLAPENPFEVIVTEAAGYRLRIEPKALDLVRFETLLRRGREALEAGNPREAHTALTEALALFRGAPLADFTYEDWARLEIARLEELRLACLEERIEVDLALGRHADLVGELEALIAEHPLRERLRGQLMLALYRSGRQSEALGAYQEARQALVDEFGIDPTRALQDLERDILLQAPTLDLERVVPQPAVRAGVLTLLFTDIESSTGLVRKLGDVYPAVLLEQRRILREAVESNGGRVVDSHGDGCFAAFLHAADAASAVAAAHRSLAEYPWPERSRVAVRAALHTGEPVGVGDSYVGLDVHRVARICAAAHGGQVLVSQETAERLEGEAPEGIGLRDLGEHSLRDLPQPEHLFQLVIAGLPDEFPQPRVESAPVPSPERSILVLADEDAVAVSLVDVAEPLARSHVPHELIVARLLEIPSSSAESSLARASTELHGLREGLAARGVAARVAAFTSGAVGEDAVRLAAEQAVDLLLLERSSSRLGADGLDPELGVMLAGAPCDVAVCVLRGNSPSGDAVLVPFGGGEHDWAALELGAWLASANDTVLRLLGVASDPEAGKRDASRLLASASLAVQQLVGVPTEPTLLPPHPTALLEASGEGLLLVTGFPSDWRERGLGSVRSELARAARPPTLFVRRGVRPGGLAPRESQTRFTWSLSEAGSVG